MVSDRVEMAIIIVLGTICSVLPDADFIPAYFYKKAHRSAFSHSLGASLIAGVLCLLLVLSLDSTGSIVFSGKSYLPLFLACTISTFSHAASDAISGNGVVLFWPFNRRRVGGYIRYDNLLANSVLSIVGLALIFVAFLMI